MAPTGRRLYTGSEPVMTDTIREQWTVLGMTCGGCSASVERVLADSPGLLAVSADAGTDSVSLEFDPSVFSRSDALGKIEDAGFDVPTDG